MKKLCIVCIAAAVIAAAAAGVIRYGTQSGGEVLKINDITVTAEELKAEMQDLKPDISGEFYRKYNINLSSKDWNREFDGVVPMAYLRDAAKNKLVEKKIKLILANENGFDYPTDFKSFYSEMEEENKKRKSKIDSGEVVYGAKSYSRKTWDAYVFSNIDTQLREKLINVTEDELKRYTEENRERFETLKYNVTCDILQIHYKDEDDKKSVFEEAERVRKRLTDGESAKKIVDEYNSPEVKLYTSQVFSNEYAGSNEMAYPEGSVTAPNMKKGDISEILDENFSAAIYICTESAEPEKSIDSIQVEYSYREDEYKKLIDRKADEANIVINEKRYSRVKL